MSARTSSFEMRQRGVSLVIVLVFLVTIMLLGLSAAMIGTQSEKMARNSREYNLAMQAAEAALRDAEREIASGTRNALIDSRWPFPSCTVAPAAALRGLCATPIPTGGFPTPAPVWDTPRPVGRRGSVRAVRRLHRIRLPSFDRRHHAPALHHRKIALTGAFETTRHH